jgi:hypothetical protein
MARRRPFRHRRWTARLLLLAVLALAGLLLWRHGRDRPEDVPWTKLDLSRPIGAFTGRKLTALRGGACRALLADAGIRFIALPVRAEGPHCGYDDAVRLQPGGAATIAWHPAGPAASCRIAASLALWEWDVVEPAALARFGRRVVAIDHFGTYNCRRIAGSASMSEHARADAIDVAGFRLDDGRLISVASDWRDRGAKGRFLHQVRDGGCRLFALTLSPDYNAAHRDHLHFDQERSGIWGWRACH